MHLLFIVEIKNKKMIKKMIKKKLKKIDHIMNVKCVVHKKIDYNKNKIYNSINNIIL